MTIALNSRQDIDFLEEARKIGDQIVDSAVADATGIYWIGRSYKEEDEVNYNLYNGSSGSLLFLIELYKITKDEKYLNVIIGGANWLVNYPYGERDRNLAFYCGMGGVVYVLLQAHHFAPDKGYQNYALKLAADCRQSNTTNNVSDILYGTSGSILTLLHIHNETGAAWILNDIETCVTKLLNDSYIYQKGICWDRGGASIHPLCGFAHGASGISFVFLELYRYFKNDIFLQIAEMAFDYEDQFFDTNDTYFNSKNNWADLRKDIYTPESVNKLTNCYVTNNLSEFFNMTYMSAWCHGAPGIGMARIHAYHITGKQHHLQYSKLAVDNTKNSNGYNRGNYTLCHGVLGNAQLMIDAYKVLQDEDALAFATRQAIMAVHEKRNNQYFVSGVSKIGSPASCDLFNGLAGIGHYYLRLVCPKEITSVLAPAIKEINKIDTNQLQKFTESYLFHFLYGKLFPNTSKILTPLEFTAATPTITFNRNEIIKQVSDLVATKNELHLNYSFELDILIIEMGDSIKSDNLYYIKNLEEKSGFNEYAFERMSISELNKLNISINNTCIIKQEIYYNYTKYVLLKVSPSGNPIEQFIIGKFTVDFLESFRHKNKVENSYKMIATSYCDVNHMNEVFGTIYKNELRNCIRAGFLVIAQ